MTVLDSQVGGGSEASSMAALPRSASITPWFEHYDGHPLFGSQQPLVLRAARWERGWRILLRDVSVTLWS